MFRLLNDYTVYILVMDLSVDVPIAELLHDIHPGNGSVCVWMFRLLNECKIYILVMALCVCVYVDVPIAE